MKNWKTTLAAAAGVLGVVAKLANGGDVGPDDMSILAALVGLVFAKDHNG